MSTAYVRPKSEPQIAIGPIVLLFVLLGLTLALVSDALRDTALRLGLALYATILYVLALALWWLQRVSPLASRWLAIASVAALIYLGEFSLGMRGLLPLLVLPVALAGPLISSRATLVVAAGETMLLAWLMTSADIDRGSVAIALVAIWGVTAVMRVVLVHATQQVQWAWEHAQYAQTLLKEARDRKVELEQALADLGHANRQLALANERAATLRELAEEAQKAKAEFVARVSHEFRTPLNMIIGLVGLMVESPETYEEEFPPDLWKDLEIVHRNCEHLSSMINDVLDLSRLEAGRLTLRREQVDITQIIDDAMAVVRPLIAKKHLDLRLALPENLPTVYCDRVRIRQVLLNVISNAARFTAEGSITVRVETDDQRMLISVSDTGPGISPEDIERVFEPFRQATHSSWGDRGGSGLGLAISRQLVELHGGRMKLEGQLGVGTTCSIELPIAEPPGHVVRPEQWIRGDWVWREQSFKGGRIAATEQLNRPRIVVYDQTTHLQAEFLHYEDQAEFVAARDLAQALGELQACPAHALLLNAATPETLWPLLMEARREAGGTPIVGSVVVPPIEPAIAAGALGHLLKPVRQPDVDAALKAVEKPVRRVLLADDDPDFPQLLARMLRRHDDALEIVIARNGREALDALREPLPDLAFLDIMMPEMDGWEVLAHMRQDSTLANIPVFLVSALDPVDQPPLSQFALATMGRGLPIGKLVRCALGFSQLMLASDR